MADTHRFSVSLSRALILVLCLSFGCTSQETQVTGPEPCSDQWNQLVESRFPTGDSMGHGPDIGGAEWKSVIEFKLGIRGDASVPSIDSVEWCGYIDEYINEN